MAKVTTTSTPQFTPAYLGINQAPNSVQAPVGSTAYMLAVTVPTPVTVGSIGFYVGTAAGSVDVGIYDSGGTRLASSGATATPAAGGKTVALSSPVSIGPGYYYLALSCNSASAAFGRFSTDYVFGNYAQASAYVLPATVTIPPSSNSRPYCLIAVLVGGATL